MKDDRITKKARRGEMIELTCKNHTNLTWLTKNIGASKEDGTSVYMARSIFFRNWAKHPECDCPAKDLIVSPEVMALEDVPA